MSIYKSHDFHLYLINFLKSHIDAKNSQNSILFLKKSQDFSRFHNDVIYIFILCCQGYCIYNIFQFPYLKGNSFKMLNIHFKSVKMLIRALCIYNPQHDRQFYAKLIISKFLFRQFLRLSSQINYFCVVLLVKLIPRRYDHRSLPKDCRLCSFCKSSYKI